MLDLFKITNWYSQIVGFAFLAYIFPKGLVCKNKPNFIFNIKKTYIKCSVPWINSLGHRTTIIRFVSFLAWVWPWLRHSRNFLAYYWRWCVCHPISGVVCYHPSDLWLPRWLSGEWMNHWSSNFENRSMTMGIIVSLL